MKFISKSSIRISASAILCFAVGSASAACLGPYFEFRPEAPLEEFGFIATIVTMLALALSYKIAGITGAKAFLFPKLASFGGMIMVFAMTHSMSTGSFLGFAFAILVVSTLVLTVFGLEPILLVAGTRLHDGRVVTACTNDE